MKHVLFNKKNVLVLIVLTIFSAIGFSSFESSNSRQDRITTTVERGDVQDIVSVSGFVEAKNTAGLSFPVTGIVTDVFIEEGDEVKKDDLLATLGARKLVAQRTDALASLGRARAARDELTTGPTKEARTVSQTTVTTAAAHLLNTTIVEDEKVANARALLLSTGLEVRSIDSKESAIAPTLSGSYTCEKEGVYTLNVYNSSDYSGYSYRFSGLEAGIQSAETRQPAALGDCGLYIQFKEDLSYANSKWIIEIPNTKSSVYVTYKNAYDLTLQQQTQNVQAAQDALDLAVDNQTFANASPSSAVLQQANASIQSAQAQVTQIDAQIADLSIVAPFDGIITDINILPGETAGATPVITVLAQDAFELKARIPEIDITKIITGQHASVVFDAQSEDTLTGTLIFVSPLATEIDGVAYFETTIALDQIPQWMRSGLNADVEISVNTIENTLRIPKRYIQTDEDAQTYVLQTDGKNSTRINVTVTHTGNDGFASITGVDEGVTLIAPTLK